MSELNTLLVGVAILVALPAIGIYGVRFGCSICVGFVPSIKETAIAIGLFCLASIPLSIINAVPAIKTNWTAQLLLFVAGLGLSAFILGARLKPQDGCSIGFKKGILVSLVWSGFGIVVIAVGTAVFFGVFMLYGAMFSTPKPQDFQPDQQVQETPPLPSKKQQDLLRAAQEIIARFPQLDVESPNKNQAAIDYVVRARDGYIAKGHEIDVALRMAANDYAEALRQAQRAYVQPSFPPPLREPSPQQRERPNCNIQPVMTDSEMAACR